MFIIDNCLWSLFNTRYEKSWSDWYSLCAADPGTRHRYRHCGTSLIMAISPRMRIPRYATCVALICLLAGCDGRPDVPRLTLTSIDGTVVELTDSTPLTALFFFSMSNPVALGAFEGLSDQLDDAVDAVGIAMHVDRPPNVLNVQRNTLVPIVIDESSRIAEAFGGVDLTPTLVLVDRGSVLLRQRGRLDYGAVNAHARK